MSDFTTRDHRITMLGFACGAAFNEWSSHGMVWWDALICAAGATLVGWFLLGVIDRANRWGRARAAAIRERSA